MPQVETMEAETEDGRLVENPDISALVQLNSAEINQQILTAHAYPRSPTQFRRSMAEMVTYDEKTALSCLYALKRSGKVIEGPSIRFAEAAIVSWKNARAGARIIDIGDHFITAQGFFYDLETNMALAFEVMRRITDKEGNRYGDDMIGVTGNAACSIGLRNAILRGIPRIYWNAPYQEARALSVGQGNSINDKRSAMIDAFKPFGVDEQQILGLLGVKGLLDVSVEHLMFMAGVLNSVKEGEQKVEDVFAVENMEHPDQVKPRAHRNTAGNPFDRGGKADDAKPAADKAETAKPAAVENVVKADPAAGDGRAVVAEAMREEAKLFVRDSYDQLMAVTKVRDIPALQDRVINAGVMDEAQEAIWLKACGDRATEIMEVAKGKKK